MSASDEAPGDWLTQQMEQWADRMGKNGEYLEFPDMYLLSQLLDINLKVFVYAAGLTAFQSVKLWKFVSARTWNV